MSDDICVNIFSGLNRLISSMANSVFQPSDSQIDQNNWQSVFIGIFMLMALVMSLIQIQQRKVIQQNHKPSMLNGSRENHQ